MRAIVNKKADNKFFLLQQLYLFFLKNFKNSHDVISRVYINISFFQCNIMMVMNLMIFPKISRHKLHEIKKWELKKLTRITSWSCHNLPPNNRLPRRRRTLNWSYQRIPGCQNFRFLVLLIFWCAFKTRCSCRLWYKWRFPFQRCNPRLPCFCRFRWRS